MTRLVACAVTFSSVWGVMISVPLKAASPPPKAGAAAPSPSKAGAAAPSSSKAGAAAPAASKTAPTAPATSAVAPPAAGSAPFRGPTRVDFDERLIKGQTTKAGAVYIFDRQTIESKPLVKRERNFRVLIIRTVFQE
jgi:hypothetical protein